MNNYNPLFPPRSDYAALHLLVINRIYHEDNLFSQRMYTLLTIHAFLVAGFCVLLTHQDSDIVLPFLLLISPIGALIALFQALYGRQTNHAIAFWREYAKRIELACSIPFDILQYDFYRDGSAKTPFGSINSQKSKGQKSRKQIFSGLLRFLKPFTSITCAVPSIFSPALMTFWSFATYFALGTL